MRKKTVWTDDELEIVRTYYPKEGGDIQERLPNHSKNSIIAKA